ncbi:hypothetical protein HanPI659440_Chr02g0089951 [Helianthus annuus]|nr:hypothetical protein HanPI659440_Chr02g0089951 [Helianthus annuus]
MPYPLSRSYSQTKPKPNLTHLSNYTHTSTGQTGRRQRPVEPFATTVVIGGVWTVERRCDYGGGVLFLRQKTAAVVVDCWWFECCCGPKGNRRC